MTVDNDRRSGDAKMDRIHQRLDDVLDKLQEMKLEQALAIQTTERYALDLASIKADLKTRQTLQDAERIEASIKADIETLKVICNDNGKNILDYLENKKFVLGIVAAVVALFGVIQAVTIKLVSNYYDDMQRKISDSIFESSRATTDLHTIREKLADLRVQLGIKEEKK